MKTKFKIVILAAGTSTRFKSNIPKVIYPLAGKPMVHYVMDLAKSVENDGIIVVVGHEKEKVIKELQNEDVSFATQEPQLGTGDAIKAAKHLWQEFEGYLIILSADEPLITEKTLKSVLKLIKQKNEPKAHKQKFGGVVFTAEVDDPHGYGRIIRDNGKILKIVEEKDASDKQKKVKEINRSTYVLRVELLLQHIDNINAENVQKEILFTDIVELAGKDGWEIVPYAIQNPEETVGINTMEQLLEAEKILEKRRNE